MKEWMRVLIGGSPRSPQAGDHPAQSHGLLQPGGCMAPVRYPQAMAERGDYEAGS